MSSGTSVGLESTQLISVIIPIYNLEKYIDTCLESILSNTYTNLEIICINDGSKDGTQKILEGYQDERIRIINKENGGLSSARNAGMKAATGEFIAFIDGDDYVDKCYFEYLMQIIGDCDIAHCSYEQASDKAFRNGIYTIDRKILSFTEAYSNYEVRSFVWGKLYRKEILERKFFSENVQMSEDKLFNASILCKEGTIALTSAKLYKHVNRPGSLTKVTGNELFPLGEELLKLADETNRSQLVEEAYKAFLSHRYLNMYEADAKDIRRLCNRKLRKCHAAARKSRMDIRKRGLFILLSAMPILYRRYRLKTDSTMIQWEQEKKTKKEHTRQNELGYAKEKMQ